MCDGIVIVIKFYANLDGADWDDKNKNQPNNTGARNGDESPVAMGSLVKNHLIDDAQSGTPAGVGGKFGTYTAPYLTDRLGVTNRDEFVISNVGTAHTSTGQTGSLTELTYPSVNYQVERNGDSCSNSPLITVAV